MLKNVQIYIINADEFTNLFTNPGIASKIKVIFIQIKILLLKIKRKLFNIK